MSRSAPLDVLLPARTRLRPPTLREGALRRSSLLKTLRSHVRRYALTLVSAPAGYGKTTLLGQFARRETDIAWATLDSEDSEPVRLVGTLLGAFREHDPGSGSRVRALLSDHPDHVRDSTNRLIQVFVNDVLEPGEGPRVLVCDDVHALDTEDACSALTTLIEYLPPRCHVVLSTRTDLVLPLARWRAEGMLGEIRTDDLRFSVSDTSKVLEEELGGSVDSTAAREVHALTEGWPAGVQLCISSLRQRERSDRPADLPESILDGERRVFDYLAEEVLERVDPEVRSFLLECSILRELDPEVCATVTGRDDATDVLHRLYRRNLFLLSAQPAGNGAGPSGSNEHPERHRRRVYRFHSLFGEFLRHRLEEEYGSDAVSALHARAGRAEQPVDRRIEHLIRGRLWQEALDLLQDTGEKLARRGAYRRVERWLDAFPSEYDRDGRHRYIRGVCALFGSDYDRAKDALDRAIDSFRDANREAATGRAEAHLATVSLVRDEMRAAETHIARAIERPVPARTEIQLLMGRARAKSIRQDWSAARTDLDRALDRARRASSTAAVHALMEHLHVVFAALPRGIDYFEQVARLARDHLGDEPSLSKLALVSQQAYVDLMRGRLDRASERCRDGFSLLETYRFGTLFMASGLMVASLSTYLARNRLDEAGRQVDEYVRVLGEMGIPDRVVPGLFYFMGRIAWEREEIDRIREAKVRIAPAVAEDKLPGAPVLASLVTGLLKLAQQEYPEAERHLVRARRLERDRRLSIVFGQATPLLAHLRRVRREEEALGRLMNTWLGRCERGGTPGYILREGELVVPLLRHAARHSDHQEYARFLLEQLRHPRANVQVVVPDTGERLTERESEVLVLIEEGKTNRQIADALHISIPTVKTHVSKILTKLDVRSRTAAAARSRELRTSRPRTPPS